MGIIISSTCAMCMDTCTTYAYHNAHSILYWTYIKQWGQSIINIFENKNQLGPKYELWYRKKSTLSNITILDKDKGGYVSRGSTTQHTFGCLSIMVNVLTEVNQSPKVHTTTGDITHPGFIKITSIAPSCVIYWHQYKPVYTSFLTWYKT